MNALAKKDNPLDAIDPKRFVIVDRQLKFFHSQSNDNRSQLEDLMKVEVSVASHRRSLFGGGLRVSTDDFKNIEAQEQQIAEKKSELSRGYDQLSADMRPVIKLWNNCKDLLTTYAVPLPTELGITGERFVTFGKGSPFATSNLVPSTASGSRKTNADPIQAYKNSTDKFEVNKREKAKVEQKPVDSDEVIAKWESVIDAQGEIGRRTSPFDHLPDPRVPGSLQIISASVGNGESMSLDAVTQLLCATIPGELKKFVRAVNPPNPDAITSDARKAKLQALDNQAIEIQFEIERAARAIEASGMTVIRPGDIDPRIFLAKEI